MAKRTADDVEKSVVNGEETETTAAAATTADGETQQEQQQQQQHTATPKNIKFFVDHVDAAVNENELKKVFLRFGKVIAVSLTTKNTGEENPPSFGFVTLFVTDDVEESVVTALNGTELVAGVRGPPPQKKNLIFSAWFFFFLSDFFPFSPLSLSSQECTFELNWEKEGGKKREVEEKRNSKKIHFREKIKKQLKNPLDQTSPATVKIADADAENMSENAYVSVAELPTEVAEDDLGTEFSVYGELAADVVLDRDEEGNSKGMCVCVCLSILFLGGRYATCRIHKREERRKKKGSEKEIYPSSK